jgi:hypothetical protein
MSKDIKLSPKMPSAKNNDFFFDSIMSIRYLRPRLIDNDLLADGISITLDKIDLLNLFEFINEKFFSFCIID